MLVRLFDSPFYYCFIKHFPCCENWILLALNKGKLFYQQKQGLELLSKLSYECVWHSSPRNIHTNKFPNYNSPKFIGPGIQANNTICRPNPSATHSRVDSWMNTWITQSEVKEKYLSFGSSPFSLASTIWSKRKVAVDQHVLNRLKNR